VADKATELEMSNDEFGIRTALTSEFELQHLKFVRTALEALVREPEADRSDRQAHFQTHSRSKTVAKPCPTPTQSDAMPREAPVRAIW
jgi:hypothetical protein